MMVIGVVAVGSLAALPFLRRDHQNGNGRAADALPWRDSTSSATVSLDIRPHDASAGVMSRQAIAIPARSLGTERDSSTDAAMNVSERPVEPVRIPPDIPTEFSPVERDIRTPLMQVGPRVKPRLQPIQTSEAPRQVATGSSATIEHVVIDGDTLKSIAEQYLGDANRAKELFEANRDVLTSPQLIPIGARLRIPKDSESGRMDDDD